MTEETILTRAGYEQLQRELNELEERLKRAVSAIADVEEDEGEEAAFFDAVTDREYLQGRIASLRHTLNNARVVDGDDDPDVVSVGNRVTVSDELGDDFTFDILSSAEVMAGRRGVTNDSPVGVALLGRRIGETVEVETPDGIAHYTIEAIDDIPPQ